MKSNLCNTCQSYADKKCDGMSSTYTGCTSRIEETPVQRVSRFVISRYNEAGIEIKNLRLQKVLYFLLGYSLADGEPLFYNQVSRWGYGPVICDMYYRFYTADDISLTVVKPEGRLREKYELIIAKTMRHSLPQLIRLSEEGLSEVEKGYYIPDFVIKEYFENNDPLNLK